MTRIVKSLGVVRFTVSCVTVAALAAALDQLGVPPVLTGVISGGIGLWIWVAPYGAKYRKW